MPVLIAFRQFGIIFGNSDIIFRSFTSFSIDPPLRHVGCLIIAPTDIYVKGKSTLVLMHSGIVNGYQLLILCQNNIGELQLFISISLTIVLFRFFFFCVCHSDSPISFFGASIVYVNNLKRTVDSVLCFPDVWLYTPLAP